MASLINYLGKNPFRYIELFPKKLPIHQLSILHQHFCYYKELPSNLKTVFQSRLARFIEETEFETRENLLLTDEMRVLISASAIQLTFGLENYYFSHFYKIIIYPQEYSSKTTNKVHLGEAQPNGILIFSWKDFKKGYLFKDDSYNLGLHEFAHALFINFWNNITMDPTFALYYDDWKQTGSQKLSKLRANNDGFIRSYAKTNLMEFFAVSVEYFFETPNKFYNHYPDLYDVLSNLLGQNPKKWLKA